MNPYFSVIISTYICGRSTPADWVKDFARILKKHKHHPRLTEPERYQRRIDKYKNLL